MAVVPISSLESGVTYPSEPAAEKVLLVDDNHVDRTLVQRLLEARGFDVVAVASASQAIVEFRSCIPDIVLMDVVIAGHVRL